MPRPTFANAPSESMPASGAVSSTDADSQTANPVAATDFARLMAALGPFEARPHIAVAVSGGPDSMALAILAGAWVKTRHGRISALIVDHGIRAESAREAAQVAGWLTRHRLAPKILHWTGPRPRRGVPAAARAARYALLEQWCAAHGVLHLLVGHQRQDQAETLLMRLGRGSGLDGLSAMAAIVERRQVRILRPLLQIAAGRLRATLTACRQTWVEDPSNRDPTQGRARLRAALPALGQDGLTVDRLADTAHHLGQARQALEAQGDALLASAVCLHPAGYLRLRRAPLAAAPSAVGLRVLARCVTTISGSLYTPRADRLQRLYAALILPAAKAATLGGCRFSPVGEDVLICRESAAVADAMPLVPARSIHWDGRFQVRTGPRLGHGLSIAALGAHGWRQVNDKISQKNRRNTPVSARSSLPAIWRAGRVLAVPHLRIRLPARPDTGLGALEMTFRPTRALSGAQFFIV